MVESQNKSEIDAVAASILEPFLHSSEVLVWAQRPDPWRMLKTGVRQYVFDFPQLLAFGTILIVIAASLFDVGSVVPPEYRFLVAPALTGLLAPATINLIDTLVRIVPFHAPRAYGATKSYAVLCRGYLKERLLRAPFSVMDSVSIVPWKGARTVNFDMWNGEPAEFLFLHLEDPEHAVAELERLRSNARTDEQLEPTP